MKRGLFSLEDFQDPVTPEVLTPPTPATPEELVTLQTQNLDDSLNEQNNALDTALEQLRITVESMNVVQSMKDTVSGKKLNSVAYYAAIESCTPLMKSMSKQLKVRSAVPSMEDFQNSYAAKDAHTVVMEGFKEFIKNLWEKIKQFVKDIAYKIMMFFKRLVGAELDIQTYEKYVADMVHRIKRDRKTNAEAVSVESKLPSLLFSEEVDAVTPTMFQTRGFTRVESMVEFAEKLIDRHLPALQKTLGMNSDALDVSGLPTVAGLTGTPEPSVFFTYLGEKTNEIVRGIHDGLSVRPVSSLKEVRSTEDIEDRLEEIFSYEESSKVALSYMIDPKTDQHLLPREYNVYVAYKDGQVTKPYHMHFGMTGGVIRITEPKIAVFGIANTNTYTTNTMTTLSDPQSIIASYEFYKKQFGKVDINEIHKEIKDFYDEINDFIKHSEKTADSLFEKVASERDSLKSHQKDADSTEANQLPIDHCELVIEGIDLFQKFLINVSSAMTNLGRSFSTDFAGTYTQVKFEFIKYLYLSAKTF